MQISEEGSQVLKAAAKPIDRPRHDNVELAFGGIAAQGIECRPLLPALGTANAMILVDLFSLDPAKRGRLLVREYA